MSWGEIYKINEHARGREFNNSYIFEGTSTRNWTVPFTGYYKIIVVGAGGTGASKGIFSGSSMVDKETAGGGAGGVAIKTMRLGAGDDYIISISSGDVWFDDVMTANGGSNGTSSGGTGGTATGGDFNYTGGNGSSSSGGSVSCYIAGLMDKTEYYTQESNTSSATDISNGYGILGHGAGGLTSGNIKIPPQKGCVIIIPYK